MIAVCDGYKVCHGSYAFGTAFVTIPSLFFSNTLEQVTDNEFENSIQSSTFFVNFVTMFEPHMYLRPRPPWTYLRQTHHHTQQLTSNSNSTKIRTYTDKQRCPFLDMTIAVKVTASSHEQLLILAGVFSRTMRSNPMSRQRVLYKPKPQNPHLTVLLSLQKTSPILHLKTLLRLTLLPTVPNSAQRAKQCRPLPSVE